jgi:type III pantothenate kinase
MRLILVDIGNSAIKLSGLPTGEPSTDSGLNSIRSPNWDEVDFSRLADEPARWIVSSVNKTTSHELTAKLNKDRPDDEVHFVSKDDLRLKVLTDQPAQVGIDRLVAAQAAWEHCKESGTASIVVDAGTAVTIDRVTNDGEFLGGIIYPGPEASFVQLSDQTASLPDLNFASRQKTISAWQTIKEREGALLAWQTNTVNAITAGVFRTQLAGLDRSVRDFLTAVKKPARVFLTGGAMPELLDAGNALGVLPDWIESAVQRPLLVLEGLQSIGQRE